MIRVMTHDHIFVVRQRLLGRVNICTMEVTIKIFGPQLHNVEANDKGGKLHRLTRASHRLANVFRHNYPTLQKFNQEILIASLSVRFLSQIICFST